MKHSRRAGKIRRIDLILRNTQERGKEWKGTFGGCSRKSLIRKVCGTHETGPTQSWQHGSIPGSSTFLAVENFSCSGAPTELPRSSHVSRLLISIQASTHKVPNIQSPELVADQMKSIPCAMYSTCRAALLGVTVCGSPSLHALDQYHSLYGRRPLAGLLNEYRER